MRFSPPPAAAEESGTAWLGQAPAGADGWRAQQAQSGRWSPRAENDDSAAVAAAAYGEGYLATKYPLQSDPRGASLALGLCWCPRVTLGGPVITRYPPGTGFCAPEWLGKSLKTLRQSSSSLPKLRTYLGMQVLTLLTNSPTVSHRLQWVRCPSSREEEIHLNRGAKIPRNGG